MNGSDPKLQIICEIAEGSCSLQEITDKAFSLFENPVHIMDMSRTVLAYTRCVEIADNRWLRTVVGGEGPEENPQQAREVRQIHSQSIQSRAPLYVSDSEVPYPRYIKILMDTTGKPLGIAVLSGIFRPLTPLDGQYLELLSTYITRQTEKEHYVFRPKERSADNLLIKLLEGTAPSPGMLRRWLDHLGWHPLRYRYLLTLQESGSPEESATLPEVLDTLSFAPNCKALVYDNAIVVVLAMEAPISGVRETLSRLIADLERWNWIGGISRCFTELTTLREAYLEAGTALRIGKQTGASGPLFDYNLCSLYHLLESLPQGVDARRFCNEKALRLSRQDSTGNMELMDTLLVYLSNSRSLAKTAQLMGIHRNTAHYRISKCMEIMGSDFSNGDEAFSILLSLRILLRGR